MEVRVEATVAATVAEVVTELGDLGGYPSWLRIVRRAAPVEAAEGDPGPAWDVDLGARVGLLSLTKRVRMVRTVCGPGRVAFERRELDGATHGRWDLTAEVRPSGDRDGRDADNDDNDDDAGGGGDGGGAGTTAVSVLLRHDGRPLPPGTDLVLRHHLAAAGGRLERRIAAGRRP